MEGNRGSHHALNLQPFQMKTELITRLHQSFEDHAHQQDGVEYWNARELQVLLGYLKWENFEQVIARAKVACTSSGYSVENHFPDVRKMVDIGSGTSREIRDIALDRYGRSWAMSPPRRIAFRIA